MSDSLKISEFPIADTTSGLELAGIKGGLNARATMALLRRALSPTVEQAEEYAATLLGSVQALSGSYATKSAADTAAVSLAEGRTVEITNHPTPSVNGIWVKRGGVLVQISTMTVAAIRATLDAQVASLAQVMTEGAPARGFVTTVDHTGLGWLISQWDPAGKYLLGGLDADGNRRVWDRQGSTLANYPREDAPYARSADLPAASVKSAQGFTPVVDHAGFDWPVQRWSDDGKYLLGGTDRNNVDWVWDQKGSTRANYVIKRPPELIPPTTPGAKMPLPMGFLSAERVRAEIRWLMSFNEGTYNYGPPTGGSLPPKVLQNPSLSTMKARGIPGGGSVGTRIWRVAHGRIDLADGSTMPNSGVQDVDGEGTNSYNSLHFSDNGGATYSYGLSIAHATYPAATDSGEGMSEGFVMGLEDGVLLWVGMTLTAGGAQSTYGCIIKNARTATSGFDVGPMCWIGRGVPANPCYLHGEIVVPVDGLGKPYTDPIDRRTRAFRIRRAGPQRDILVPELLTLIPDPPMGPGQITQPSIVPVGDNGMRVFIRTTGGTYTAVNYNGGREGYWSSMVYAAATPTPAARSHAIRDPEGDLVLAWNAFEGNPNRENMALSILNDDGTERARLVFDPRGQVNPDLSEPNVFPIWDATGKWTRQYGIIYDWGRNKLRDGVDPATGHFAGALVTARVFKDDVLAGDRSRVVIYDEKNW
jgi:hypothetical protein